MAKINWMLGLAGLTAIGCGSEVTGDDAPSTNTITSSTGAGMTSTDGMPTTTGSNVTNMTSTSSTSGGNNTTGPTNTSGVATSTSGGDTSGGTMAGTTGVGGGTGTTTGSSTTGESTEPYCDTTVSGEEFYMNPKSCVKCHKDDALGGTSGPEVRHPNSDYMHWIIRTGRDDHPDYEDGMEALAEDCITDQQIDEILTFLNSFPQPTTGAELYADYCAFCHAADGSGGISKVSLDGELHHNSTIVSSGANTMLYDDRGRYMPAQGDKLTAAETQLITDYLQNELGL